MFLLSSADFYQNLSKGPGEMERAFRNTIRVSNGLNPDQDQCSVGCLQSISADDKKKN